MNEILKKIGDILGIKKETALEDVKDSSGNIIRIDEWKMESGVWLISNDGTLIPLEDGSYSLEDGREFEVAGGKISNITKEANNPDGTEAPVEEVQPIQKEAEAAPAEPAPVEEPSKDAGMMEQRIATLEEKIANLENMIGSELSSQVQELSEYVKVLAEKYTDYEQIKKDLQKDNKELKDQVEELSKLPAGDPVNVVAHKTTNKKDVDGSVYSDMLKEVRANRNMKK